MNRLAIRGKVRSSRFDASQDSDINDWIDQAYVWVWDQSHWRFRYVPPASFALVAGQQSYNPFPTFRRNTINVFNTYEEPLVRLGITDFHREYQAAHVAAQYGVPEAFAVEDGIIYLGPTPASLDAVGGWVEYERRVCHYQSDGVTITAGLMDEDTDLPFWNVDHHSILIPAASVIGLGTENDETVAGLIRTRDMLLGAMVGELGADPYATIQYGG